MDCYILAVFGWALAIMFGYFYIMAQNKLDDYRTDSQVLRKLMAKYGDILPLDEEPTND